MTTPVDNPNDSPPRRGQSAGAFETPTISIDQAERLDDLCRQLADDLASTLTGVLNGDLQITPVGLRFALRRCWGGAELERCLWPVSDGVSLALSVPLAGAMVDCLTGGVGDSLASSDEITSIDRRLLSRVAKAAGEAVGAFRKRLVREQASRSARSARPGPVKSDPQEPLLVASFGVLLGGREELLHLAFAGEFLAAVLGEPSDSDGSGGASQQSAPGGTVDLSVISLPTASSPEQLAALAPGDVLVSETGVDSDLLVRVDGEEKFTAHLGSRNGKRAITLTGRIPDEPQGE